MSNPVRVLQVFAEMNIGGAETMIMTLYRNINRSKVQFDFVVHTNQKGQYEEEIESLGGKIYRFPKYTGKNHFFYKKAWVDFFESHPEYKIVHGHLRTTASIYLRLANKFNRETIAHSHSTASRGNKFEQVVKNIMQYSIRYTTDYMFACSDESGKWLFGKKCTRKSNYRLIKNAIKSEDYFISEIKRNQTRRLLNLEQKFVVGHIGSFTEPKNHKFIIDVFYEVIRREKNSVLLLVGDGKLRKNIEKKARKLGINDSIIFLGIRTDIANLLQAMDVFIFPSVYEGLPVTLIEAQASSLKIFASDTITKEVKITDNIEFVSLNSPAREWASRMIKYSNGYEKRNTSQEIVDAGYDVKNNAQELEQFYVSIVSE